MYQYKWQILDQTNISYFLFWGQHMITENKIEANLYLPLYIYKWDLDLFERLYCCCLDFQPHWLLLTFRPLLAIPACFKSPKRDNCLLVYVVSTLTLCVLHMYLSDAAVHVSILDWKVFPNFNWNNLTSQWKFVTFPISGFCYIYTPTIHFFQCLQHYCIWNLILSSFSLPDIIGSESTYILK